jgi:DNA-binding CsgD family transcriptional regulator
VTVVCKYLPVRSRARIAKLTKQELKILQMACEQLQDDEIAAELGISLNTVASHWRSVRLKMNCDSKFQVISQAFMNGVKVAPSSSKSVAGDLNLPVLEISGPLAEIIAETASLPRDASRDEPFHLLVRCHTCSDSTREEADRSEAAELRARYNS